MPSYHDALITEPVYSIEETSSTGEIMTFEKAKEYLGVTDTRHDSAIQDLVEEVTRIVEDGCDRTLRTSVERVVKMNRWPSRQWSFDQPPLLNVTQIEYFDSSGQQQTLDSSHYSIVLSKRAAGKIVWTPAFTRPAVAEREDAIEITYTSGSATANPTARAAAKLYLELLWDHDDTPGAMKLKRETAEKLVDKLKWGGYA